MFQVETREGGALYELSTLAGKDYSLAGIRLGGNLQSVQMLMNSSGVEYEVSTQIVLKENEFQKIIDPAVQYISKLFTCQRVSEDLFYVLCDQGRPEIAICRENDNLFVEMGGILSNTPRKKVDKGIFPQDMLRYFQIVSGAVNGLLDYFGELQENKIELLVRIPAFVKVENKIGKNIRAGKMSGSGGRGSNGKEDLLVKSLIQEKSDKTFSDIGGQKKAVEEFQWLADCIKNSSIYKDFGIRPVKSILLVGPPGTGKTLLAQALASNIEATFFSLSAVDIISKWVGDSEKSMQAIFNAAEKNSPSIIFIDEIDAITRKRGGNTHEATDRIIATINVNLSGMREKEGVWLIAATNQFKNMDSSIVRPGRFDKVIHVELPDQQGRKEIFRIHLENAQKKASKNIIESGCINLDQLADATCGLSGAEIQEIIRRSIEKQARHYLRWKTFEMVDSSSLMQEVNNYESRDTEDKQKVVMPFCN